MEKRIYRFKDFQLEPDECRLSAGEKQIALTPKVFEESSRFIETVPKLGYRFVAPVTWIERP